MPLRRIALVVTVLLVGACAAGVDDGIESSSDATQPSAPVVPFHEISGEAPEEPQPIEVRTTIDERANMRAVIAWDFEPASADCNGWSATGASAIRAIPSHTGTYACKLCADGSAREMKLTRRLAGLPKGRWVVSAWLRRSGSAIANAAARVALDEANETAGIPSSILLIDDWRLLADPLDVTIDVASTTVSIIATAPPGECVHVDDVLVESATAKAAHTPLLLRPDTYSTNRAPRNER